MAAANPFAAGKTASLSAPFGAAIDGWAGARAAPWRAGRNDDAPPRSKRPNADAEALAGEDDFFDRAVAPVAFGTGEAAIAVGWSYIDDLESSLSSLNAAINALNSRSAEIARQYFGDSVADRVQKHHEAEVDAAKYRLDYRVSSIGRAFGVSGNLVETDDGGTLAMGRFTLTHDGGDFRAAVGTDQQAWITRNGAARRVSVHRVVADLACGKLPL